MRRATDHHIHVTLQYNSVLCSVDVDVFVQSTVHTAHTHAARRSLHPQGRHSTQPTRAFCSVSRLRQGGRRRRAYSKRACVCALWASCAPTSHPSSVRGGEERRARKAWGRLCDRSALCLEGRAGRRERMGVVAMAADRAFVTASSSPIVETLRALAPHPRHLHRPDGSRGGSSKARRQGQLLSCS